MAGSFIPFAKTKAEREKARDPRLSIEERYSNQADYLRRVDRAANQLVKDRYLLPEHVKPVVEAAGQHWGWIMGAQSGGGSK
jgi:Alpha/beta hydrolase domain